MSFAQMKKTKAFIMARRNSEDPDDSKGEALKHGTRIKPLHTGLSMSILSLRDS